MRSEKKWLDLIKCKSQLVLIQALCLKLHNLISRNPSVSFQEHGETWNQSHSVTSKCSSSLALLECSFKKIESSCFHWMESEPVIPVFFSVGMTVGILLPNNWNDANHYAWERFFLDGLDAWAIHKDPSLVGIKLSNALHLGLWSPLLPPCV